MVTIKNVHNDTTSKMTDKQWNELKDNSQYAGRFILVEDAAKKPETPKEVAELDAKNYAKAAETAQPKTAEKAAGKPTAEKN